MTAPIVFGLVATLACSPSVSFALAQRDRVEIRATRLSPTCTDRVLMRRIYRLLSDDYDEAAAQSLFARGLGRNECQMVAEGQIVYVMFDSGWDHGTLWKVRIPRVMLRDSENDGKDFYVIAEDFTPFPKPR